MSGVLIGITGNAFAGKDTAGLYMKREYGFEMQAFSDPIRDGLVEMIGLDPECFMPENKENVIEWLGHSSRDLMISLGTDWGRERVHPLLWVTLMERKILPVLADGRDVVVTDVRKPNEAEMIRRLGGEIWRITRAGGPVSKRADSSTETDVAKIEPDRTLWNTGAKAFLLKQIDYALVSARLAQIDCALCIGE